MGGGHQEDCAECRRRSARCEAQSVATIWILTILGSDVDKHLEEIVPRLLKVFSSREGYKAFDDALPVREYFLGYECSEADARQ